jgi:hypothetical protein
MGTDGRAIEYNSREAEIVILLLAITDKEDANELDMTMDISIHPLGFNCCSSILLLPFASRTLNI